MKEKKKDTRKSYNLRIEEEIYGKLQEISKESKKKGKFISMNRIIKESIKEYLEK